jgi:anionic cell wall polymer biosynthesis LytR-Cps2A-Psr (LCP) family protein
MILAGTGVFLYAQIRTDKITELLKKGKPFTVAFFVTDTGNTVTRREALTAAPGGVPAAAQTPAAGTTGGGAVSQAARSPAAARTPVRTTVTPAENNKLLFTELFSYDPKTHKGALLDIPGNVGSLINSIQKIGRIDVLFKPGKVDAYRAKIESLIGSSIPLYIETDITDIPKIVDLLGGLNLFIANPVEETKTSPMVLLPSGSITLDGSKVESYLSYTASSDGEIEVISRRQRFIQALLKTIGENSSLFDRHGVYSAFKGWITTDMNRRSMLSFIALLPKLDAGRMVFQRVLGVNRTVDHQQLLFPHYDGRLLRETMRQTLASLAGPQVLSDQGLSVRLQILNGTLVSGLAHRTSQIFQSFGYDIAALGNANRQDYAHTEILDRTGNIAQAQKVGSIIQCTRVESKLSSGRTQSQPSAAVPAYDVTIILGKDFDGRYCK